MRAEFTSTGGADRAAAGDAGRIHGHRHHQRHDEASRTGGGHGRAFEIRFSDEARESLRGRHEGGHREHDDRGPREGRGHGHHVPFGRIVASLVRDGIQSLLRALGGGETSRTDDTDSGSESNGAATTGSGSEASGAGTTVTATVTVSTAANNDTASQDDSGESADDPLTAFSKKLAQVVSQGLRTMFELMGFGSKPETSEGAGATATHATTATDTTGTAGSDGGAAAASDGDKAAEHSGFPGRGHAYGRVARFLMAGVMLAAMVEGFRSLKEMFASDGSETADNGSSAETQPPVEASAQTGEAAKVDIAA